MQKQIRKDADQIISTRLKAIFPDETVQQALKRYEPSAGTGSVRKLCAASPKECATGTNVNDVAVALIRA